MEDKKINIKKIAIIIGLIVVALVICIFLLLRYTNIFAGLITNNLGNTMGNLRNYGYSAKERNRMYFITPNDDSNKVRINKAKLNGKDSTIIYETDYDLLSLNVYKDKLYFIALKTNSEAQSYNLSLDDNETPIDYVDNKIYQMDLDGKNLTVLNDNEFSNQDYQIAVTNNKIYYIGTDNNIYNMNLDGSDKKAISSSKTGFLGMSNKYIVYNDYSESQKILIERGQQPSNPEYVTYIMDINGNDPHIVDGTRFYSVDIIGNTIYYKDADKNICKINVDGTEKRVLLNTTAYNMNASRDRIYYLNYKDEANNDYNVGIFSCNFDGSDNKLITTLTAHSQFLDLVNNNPLYMDARDNSGKIYMYDVKKKEETELYSISYSTIDEHTEEDDDEYIDEHDDTVDNELEDSHAL